MRASTNNEAENYLAHHPSTPALAVDFPEERMAATFTTLQHDLTRLGIAPGALLMVHAGVRSLGPVTGGVNTILQALFATLTPTGTLCAYLDFEPFYDTGTPIEDTPVFDKRLAHAARDHGILHETFRNWPGTLRSDHPDAGVAAHGPLAHHITRDHPFQYGYGPGSPLERIAHLQGQVLMLGAPLDTITLLHYAEHLARIPHKRTVRYRRRMPTPTGPAWVDFEEYDTSEPVHPALPENCFEQIARAYLAAGHGRTARVAQAPAYLFDGAHLVAFAVRWLEEFPY